MVELVALARAAAGEFGGPTFAAAELVALSR
jgi:hypothetical protein